MNKKMSADVFMYFVEVDEAEQEDLNTVKLLIQAGPLIQAGSLIQAGGIPQLF
jgi:hypothetical protein